MRISFTSIKISIAGAKLSHLVKKNRVWDHGSMVEQVKAVFMQLQKFRAKGDEVTIKKYLTAHGYELFKHKIDTEPNNDKIFFKAQADLQDIDIIEVHEGKKTQRDCFVALIKARQKLFSRTIDSKVSTAQVINYKEVEFKLKCFFVLEGEWWLLDEIEN